MRFQHVVVVGGRGCLGGGEGFAGAAFAARGKGEESMGKRVCGFLKVGCERVEATNLCGVGECRELHQRLERKDYTDAFPFFPPTQTYFDFLFLLLFTPRRRFFPVAQLIINYLYLCIKGIGHFNCYLVSTFTCQFYP